MSGASHRFNNDLRYRSGDHDHQRQLTPPYVLEPVRAALGRIGLDPCTEPDNPTGADMFYTVDDDGLSSPWCGLHWHPSIFVNPPYSKAREPWAQLCMNAGFLGQRVVLLIPSHTDTRLWYRLMRSASAVCFIRGRVKFGVLRSNRRQEAASHPSALVCWNLDPSPLSALGTVLALDAHDALTAETGEQ